MQTPHRLTAAERARTLASGFLAGEITAPGPAGRVRVGCVTDDDGTTAILVADGPDRVALDMAFDGPDVPAVLDVLDAPLVPPSPPRARLWLSGWMRAVPAHRARGWALACAARRPAGALLEVNNGCALYLLDPTEVRLTTADGMADIDLDDYLAARPDPLHGVEQAVLADLARTSSGALTALARAALGAPLPGGAAVHPVGLDRYGLDLAYRRGQWFRRVRIPFPNPVADERELTAALGVLIGGCYGAANIRTN
jgi:hypothetical protein